MHLETWSEEESEAAKDKRRRRKRMGHASFFTLCRQIDFPLSSSQAEGIARNGRKGEEDAGNCSIP